ncbi:hypothetical protein KDA08_03290, partial [Candidatus Saccharibacteria bacterium]|nr:hypothetical protein [Candidatus Saccharibacteria bacterium]
MAKHSRGFLKPCRDRKLVYSILFSPKEVIIVVKVSVGKPYNAMRSRIINNLQNKAFWWKFRVFFEREVTFRSFRQGYSIKHGFREEKVSSRILRHSFRSILKTGLLAVAFVVVTELFSKLAKNVSFTLGSDELGLLLSTVVTVTGVFLGLYFTALSAVAGNLFMRAPENLQNLFLRDRKGKQYIKTLVLTTIIGIYYLLLRSFGYDVGFLGPILVTILALYAVVRFMALGSQTFYFLHPGEAGSTLSGDAANAINDATAGTSGWKKPYLQKHYRKQARDALATLSDLVDFGIDPVKLSGSQLLDIAKFSGGLMIHYIGKKKQIPSDSLWFATKHEHQNWLLTEESAITMALNTGTSLQPKDIKNKLWFEEECLDIVLKVFKHLVETKQWGYAQLCLEVLVSVIEQLGSDFYEDVADLIIKRVNDAVEDTVINAENPENEDDKRGHIAIVDSIARLPIGVLVSLTRYMGERTCSDLLKEIDAIKWSRETSPYKNKMPGRLLIDLETTHRSYVSEVAIEGKQISPQWYIRTITTQQYLRFMNKYYEYVKSLNKDFYEDKLKKLLQKHKYLQTAHLTDRWIEFSNKLLSLGWRVQRLVDDCVEQKKVQDLPWTSIDPDTEKELLQGYNQEAIDKLALLITPLSTLPKAELKDLPDYFGQAYTFGLEAAYIAAMENNANRLKSLFPSVFAGALRAYQNTRADVEGWAEQSKILFSSEPIEDILTLSGFIKIYSELHHNEELWGVCQETWDNY